MGHATSSPGATPLERALARARIPTRSDATALAIGLVGIAAPGTAAFIADEPLPHSVCQLSPGAPRAVLVVGVAPRLLTGPANELLGVVPIVTP